MKEPCYTILAEKEVDNAVKSQNVCKFVQTYTSENIVTTNFIYESEAPEKDVLRIRQTHVMHLVISGEGYYRTDLFRAALSPGMLFFSFSGILMPTAAEVGLTCLKDVAAGIPKASLISFTSCQLLNASKKLIYPGLPLSISIGSSLPSCINIFAGF